MSDERLKALQASLEAYRAAGEALVRAHEAKASGFEQVRHGKFCEKAAQKFSDLLAKINGEPPRKLPPLPLGEALVPKKKPTDQ
jgi:hypothetical protein